VPLGPPPALCVGVRAMRAVRACGVAAHRWPPRRAARAARRLRAGRCSLTSRRQLRSCFCFPPGAAPAAVCCSLFSACSPVILLQAVRLLGVHLLFT
jgi:hypothetical protein